MVRKKLICFLSLIFVSSSSSAGIKFVDTNDAAIKAYDQKVLLAKSYLKEVEAETAKSESVIKAYRVKGLSPAVPAQGKVFFTLQAKGEKLFGTNIYEEPFGRCGGLGIAASNFWLSKLSENNTKNSIEGSLYADAVKDCRNQILNKPKATVTVEVTPASDKPPFKNCLLIIDVEGNANASRWTCEKATVEKH